MTPKTILRDVGKLSTRDLIKLDALLHDLIETRQHPKPEAIERDHQSAATKARPSRRAYIELKMINGCGPYKYKRFWQHGRLRSEYVGKA
jgi:hypothetical protein